MCQPLLTYDFKWMTEDQILEFDFIKNEPNIGYILEVDLEYPKQFHDEHNDYPLCSETTKIDKESLSPYAKPMMKKLGGCCGTTNKSLMTLSQSWDETKKDSQRNITLRISLAEIVY